MSINLSIPFAIATAAKPGVVAAATVAAEATEALSPGIYKLAAMGQPILWAVDSAVSAADGSYLAAGDQELIKIPGTSGGAAVNLHFINSADAGGDGSVNIVEVEFYEVPGTKPNGNYDIPA